MLTACLSMMLHLLLLLIRIAIKLRLSIPLVYLVLMLTAFRPWYRAHTAFADGIFLALVGCTVLSWIISLVRFVRRGLACCQPSFFCAARWADAAFVWRRPARMRGRPVKPHTLAQRAPRRGTNGCSDVHFLTRTVVRPSVLRPQAALGSGFSLQAAFWYQNAMLALFLRSKKSLKRSLSLMPPFRTPHII